MSPLLGHDVIRKAATIECIAYCSAATEGPSHGYRQHAHNVGEDWMCSSGGMLARVQKTRRQTHAQTGMLITVLDPLSYKGRIMTTDYLSWRRGVVVSGVRRMNEVNPRRARLVPGCMTVFGRVYRLSM